MGFFSGKKFKLTSLTLKGGEGNDYLFGWHPLKNKLYGNGGDDTLVAVGLRNYLYGGDGNDTLTAFGVKNKLDGGAGDDKLFAFGVKNTLYGGSGDDFMFAAGVSNYLDGGSGDDVMFATGVYNDMDGGSGDDKMTAVGVVNKLYGGSGDDFMFATGVYNKMDGGSGDDFISAIGVVNNINGGSGDDFILSAGVYSDIDGGSGNDIITSLGVVNNVDGGSGNDIISAIGVINNVDGGSGNDIIFATGVYNSIEGGLGDDIITALGVINDVNAGAGDDFVAAFGVYNNIDAGAGDDIVITGGLLSVVDGGSGDDVITALGLSNIIDAGSGDDVVGAFGLLNYVDGGAGDDVIVSTGLANYIDAGSGDDVVAAFGLTNYIDGGSGDDVLTAAGLLNVMDGGSGDDVIVSIGLSNFIDGGSGDDIITALGATNFIDGGSGDDAIVTAGIMNYVDGGDGDDFIMSLGLNNFILGGDGEDTIITNGVLNEVFAGDGDDFVLANGISNIVDGGEGNDTLIVNGLINTIFGGAGEDVIASFGLMNTIDGGSEDDTIVSGALINTVTGNEDDDFILGGGMVNTLLGESGNDVIIGGGLINTIFTGSGDDIVAGGGLINTIVAESGDNFIVGGGLINTIGAGEGDDVIIGGGLVNTILDLGGDQQGDVDNIIVGGGLVNSIISGNGNDIIIGGGLVNTIATTGGDNIIAGGGMVNTIISGEGDDILVGGGYINTIIDLGGDALSEVSNTIIGGGYINTIVSGDGNDVVVGGGYLNNIVTTGGDNVIVGGGYENAIYSGDGDDIIVGGGYINTIIDDGGDNVIVGGGYTNTIKSGNGDEVIVGGGYNNYIETGDGEKVIVGGGYTNVIKAGNAGPDGKNIIVGGGLTNVIESKNGNDVIVGGGQTNEISAGDGDNIVVGGGQTNKMTAGSGDDVMVGGGQTNEIHAGDGDNTVVGGGQNNLITAGSGKDIIVGGGQTNEIQAGDGDNIVVGGGQYNTITAGSGDDILVGGGQYNTIKAGDGNNTVVGGGQENLIEAGSGKDVIVGGGQTNTIHAGDGDNTVVGGGQTNLITSGSGDDIIVGGGQTNEIQAGEGNNTVVGGGQENLIVAGSGDDIIVGGGQKNTIHAGGGNNTVVGGGQENTITSGDGNDVLVGGGQTNTITSGAGEDDIVGGGQYNTITVGDGEKKIIGGGQENTIVTGNAYKYDESGNKIVGESTIIGGGVINSITSGLGHDTIFGGGQDNVINAGDGDNNIVGGGENNTINTGAGSDMIVGGGVNNIINSTAGNDIIIGGGKNNTITAGDGEKIVLGGGATNSITVGNSLEGQSGLILSGGVDNTVVTGEGAHVIVGGGKNNTLTDAGGNNIIIGFGQTNRARTGNGDGIIIAAGDDNRIDALNGNNIIVGAGIEKNGIKVGDGDNLILGASINRSGIELGDGQNIVMNAGQRSIVWSGEGSDTIISVAVGDGEQDINDASDNNTEAASGDSHVYAHGGDNVVASVGYDSLVETGSGNDVIISVGKTSEVRAGSGDNIIFGSGKDNNIITEDGSDFILTGIANKSTVATGLGSDTIIGLGWSILSSIMDPIAGVIQDITKGAKDAIDELIRFGSDLIDLAKNEHVTEYIDGLIDSLRFDFIDFDFTKLVDDDSVLKLQDEIYAGAGDDFIVAGSGSDIVYGKEGSDIYGYWLGDGDDIIDEQNGDGADVIEIYASNYVLGHEVINANEDITFRLAGENNQDLIIDLTIFNGESRGSLTIKDMNSSSSQVEELRLFELNSIINQFNNEDTQKLENYQRLDLVNIYNYLVANNLSELSPDSGIDIYEVGSFENTDQNPTFDEDGAIEEGEARATSEENPTSLSNIIDNVKNIQSSFDGISTQLEGSMNKVKNLNIDDYLSETVQEFKNKLTGESENSKAGEVESVDLDNVQYATGWVNGSNKADELTDADESVDDNVINGYAGNDMIRAGSGADIINGGDDNDTLSYEMSNSAVRADLYGTFEGGDAEGDMVVNIENLTGTSFDDELSGDMNDNILIGGEGNDILDGRFGNDEIYGGRGDDIIIASDSEERVLVDKDNNIVLDKDNNSPRTKLVGYKKIDGGEGMDTIDFRNNSKDNGVKVDLEQQNVTLDYDIENPNNNIGNVSYDVSSIENVTGSEQDDYLIGNSGDNIIDGAGGNDVIFTSAGNDTIKGGAGDDVVVITKDGNPRASIDGGEGNDTLDFSEMDSALTFNAEMQMSVLENRNLYWTESIESVNGTDYNDTLIGDSDDNYLDGGKGDDVLDSGRGGNDILTGGLGTDTFVINYGQDAVTTITDFKGYRDEVIDLTNFHNIKSIRDLEITQEGADVHIKLTNDQTLILQNTHTSLLSYENFKVNVNNVNGTEISETLVGLRTDDIVNAGVGDDIINAGEGNNTLTGGEGNDKFIISKNANGTDIIKDYQIGEKIDLSGVGDIVHANQLDIIQDGSDTVIKLFDDQKIVLEGINKSEIDNGVFEFGITEGERAIKYDAYLTFMNEQTYQTNEVWQGYNAGNTGLRTFADVNGDGKMDYITMSTHSEPNEGNTYGTHYISLSNGDGYENVEWYGNAVANTGTKVWTDLNGDGKADYVTNGTHSVDYVSGKGFAHYVSLSTEDGFDNQIWYSSYGFGTGGVGIWTDLNGDGMSDYTTMHTDGQHFVSLSTGEGYTNQIWRGHGVGNSGVKVWTDVNGDGMSDYVTMNTDGNHYVSLSTGEGYINQTWQGNNLGDTGIKTWTDLNGDGMSDYVTFNMDGTHRVSISTGEGYINQCWDSFAIGNTGKYEFADINGDGMSDYVTLDHDGTHYISLSAGDNYVNTIIKGYGVGDTGFATWADLNGDGKSDYIAVDSNGGHLVSLSEEDTSGLEFSDIDEKVVNGTQDNDVIWGHINSENIRFYENSMYYHYQERISWWESEFAAISLGGHLVTINDAEEQAFIINNYNMNQNIWIGLTDYEQEGVYKWISGEESDYRNWYPTEPNNYYDQDYIAIQGAVYDDRWHDVDDNQWGGTSSLIEIKDYDFDKAIYAGAGNDEIHALGGNDIIFGEADNDKIFGDAGGDIIRGGDGADTISGGEGDDYILADDIEALPEGGIYWNGSYYYVIDEVMGWHDAENQAVEMGGHLVAITSQEEQDWINNNLIQENKSYWGGLTDEVSEGVWKWTSGEAFDYSNWQIGEPNSSTSGTSDYINIWSSTDNAGRTNALGKWNDGPDGGFDYNYYEYSDKGFSSIIEVKADDIVDGDAGNDEIYGGIGNDTLNGGDGHDIIYGGSENDTISGGEGNDYLVGDEGDDSITGDAGNDDLVGGAGADILSGGTGDNMLTGGTGKDAFVISKNQNGTDVIEDYQTDEVIDLTGIDNIIHLNQLEITQLGNDTIIKLFDNQKIILRNYNKDLGLNIVAGNTSEDNDKVYGDNGDNELIGGNGNDIIQAGAGNDTLVGDKVLPEGGEYWNGSRYYVTDEAMTWHEAEAKAVEMGGHLVAITSQEEQDWINQTFGVGEDLWIGLTDEVEEGVFKWTSGEAFEYSNWNNPYEPNNYGGDEDYIHMWGEYDFLDSELARGKWNDTDHKFYEDTGFDARAMRGIIEIKVNNEDSTTSNESTASGNDYLVGGYDNDTLIGGTGNDTYHFDYGFGKDVIRDEEGDRDSISFGRNISARDIYFTHEGTNLVINFYSTDDQITIEKFFEDGYHNIEAIKFIDDGIFDLTTMRENPENLDYDVVYTTNNKVSVTEDKLTEIHLLDNDEFENFYQYSDIIEVNTTNNGYAYFEDGKLFYQGYTDFSGQDTVEIVYYDPNNVEHRKIININVEAVNDAPIININKMEIEEDSVLSFDVFEYISDAENESVELVSVEDGLNGSTEIVDGKVVYTPNQDFYGLDWIDCKVRDAHGNETIKTIEITIKAVNDAPVLAQLEEVTMDEEVSVTLDVLKNASDAEGHGLSIEDVVCYNGKVSIFNGKIIYTPNKDFYGEDSVVYTVTDNNGEFTTAKVDVVINNVNDAPVINLSETETIRNKAVEIDVLSQSVDVDGDIFLIESVENGSNGVASIVVDANGNQVIKYVPNKDFFGTDVITCKVSDVNGAVATKEIEITVNDTNEAPVVRLTSVKVDEDNSLEIDVLAETFDADGDEVSIASVVDGQNGVASIVFDDNGKQVINYTASADFNGVDTITYTIKDSRGAEVTKTLDVVVNSVNDEVKVINSVEDRVLSIGDEIDIDLSNLFSDADVESGFGDDELSYSLRVSDGSKLPSWLSFDSESMTLTGAVPLNITAPELKTFNDSELILEASDKYDSSNQVRFSMSVDLHTIPVISNGNSSNDILEGNLGNDILTGNYGNDIIKGGAGDDLIYGDTSTGDFSFIGFNNISRVSRVGGKYNDTIDSLYQPPIAKNELKGDFNGDGDANDTVSISSVRVGGWEIFGNRFGGDDMIVADMKLSGHNTSDKWINGDSGMYWNTQKWLSGDFNGDGVDDLVNIFDDNSGASADVKISTGEGFVSERWMDGSGGFWDTQKWLVGDFNGDGRDDLVNIFDDNGGASADVKISTNEGFVSERWMDGSGGFWDTQKWLVGDFNGDGRDDLANIFNDNGMASIDVKLSSDTNDDGVVDSFVWERWGSRVEVFNKYGTWTVEDTDNDGIEELVSREYLFGSNSVNIYESDAIDNDLLFGGAGNDTVKGGMGEDLISGGLGADELFGNSGSDTFSFGSLDDSTISTSDINLGIDTIHDFAQGEDKIDLTALGFDGIVEGDGYLIDDNHDGIIDHNDTNVLGYYHDSDNNTIIADSDSDFAIKLIGEFDLTDDDLLVG